MRRTYCGDTSRNALLLQITKHNTSTKTTMKNKTLLLILILTTFFGCASKTEEQAMKEVGETWGQVTNMSKGVAASSDKESGKYFEVEVVNPDFFSAEAERVSISGGVAFLLYKRFSKEEKETYSRYDIKLIDTLDHEEEFSYPAFLVAQFYTQEALANKYLQRLLKGDLQFINNQYSQAKQIGVDSIKTLYDPLLQKFPESSKVETYKVRTEDYFFTDSSKIEVIRFEGAILKEKESAIFSILIDPAKTENNIVSIKYWME